MRSHPRLVPTGYGMFHASLDFVPASKVSTKEFVLVVKFISVSSVLGQTDPSALHMCHRETLHSNLFIHLQ